MTPHSPNMNYPLSLVEEAKDREGGEQLGSHWPIVSKMVQRREGSRIKLKKKKKKGKVT